MLQIALSPLCLQVIDGSLRIILVEGLGNGWMRQISHLCVVASSEENPEHCKRMRKVLWSRLHCHSERVLASLGIHVEQVKLRAPLLDLVAEPGTFSTGRVRELCREGVRRLSNMVRADFTRVAEDLRLFPTGEMIDVVYKKFGGELTKEDVAGWEPPVAGRNRRSTTRERAVSGRSAKGSVKDMEGAGESRGDEGPMEEDARKPYVYPWNEDFLEEKARREEERMRTDWKSLNKAYVRDVEDTGDRERYRYGIKKS